MSSFSSAPCCEVEQREILQLRRRVSELETAHNKCDSVLTSRDGYIEVLNTQVQRLNDEHDSDDFLFKQLDQRCTRVYRRFGAKGQLDPPAVFTHYYEWCIDGRCDDDAAFIAAVKERLADEDDRHHLERILDGKLQWPFRVERVIYAYTIRHIPDSIHKTLRDAQCRDSELEHQVVTKESNNDDVTGSSGGGGGGSNVIINKRQRVDVQTALL